MNTLEVDSLTPPASFEEGLPVHQVANVGVRGTGCGQLRPYAEVAALLAITGVFQDVPSIQQIVDIENRAMRKLKRHPGIRKLYREIYGRTPEVA